MTDLLLPVRGPRPLWKVLAYVLVGLYAGAAVVSVVLDTRVSSFVQLLPAAFFAASAWLRWRPVHANDDGIRRQSLFRATPWSDVDALIEPGRWDDSVHLRTAAGKDLPTGVPARYLDSLLALSGKPVEQRLSAAAKPPTKEQRDLSERAARVRARNGDLMDGD